MRLDIAGYSMEGHAQVDDQIYLKTAAVLEDYEFDRVRFQVSKEAFVSTDMAHWLALDVASQALADAKLLDAGEKLRERIGVYIGNSLTGEFSRANLLRLRWPFVRRVLTAALQKNASLHNGDLHQLLSEIETLYKSPFPATTEESLAGGLSNTIAGRICNYFNFKGGGYTVDGACASSLLAVTTACSALESGDVDVAIAGGVDLSLDPFELAGFSKLNALAKEKMRVFDANSAGFLPGEGAGMVVLMRHEEAAALHHSSYAILRGWGISSDGRGGITRPELDGQLLALRRAYHRAGYGIDSVSYFEGHGTGTSVGDATELQALSQARREARSNAGAAALGSIKANIGHTKAAAGVAGLIKATMAVQTKILPPTTGCDTPHPELTTTQPVLRVLKQGELWPHDDPVRAGVSAMGFGGINTHVTLEAADNFRRRSFTGFEQQQLLSPQDCELFLFQAADTACLTNQIREVLDAALEISSAELTDFAAALANQLKSDSSENSVRAACIASSPDELEANLRKLLEWCTAGAGQQINVSQGVFLREATRKPIIGFLFTGQGSPVYTNGGIWERRFADIRELYQRANLPKNPSISTETAQPCVVTASLAGLQALSWCGIEAGLALGHSLGEITALFWAGAFSQEDLLRIVHERGRIMAQMATPSGSMASIRADCEEVKRRINGDALSIAAYNSCAQTVVSGDAEAVRQFAARLSADGIATALLPVSHAFHSPLVANVAGAFHGYLDRENFGRLQRRVVSTVNGALLEEEADLRELLTNQITMPVQFAGAMTVAAGEADLFIEVGPGSVLAGIASESIDDDKPVIALNVGSESLRGLLLAAGAAFAMGAKIRPAALFEDRFVRRFDLKRRHTFLQNPCETVFNSSPVTRPHPSPVRSPQAVAPGVDSIEVLRNLVAQRTELPLATIRPESRFLDDLHLNSITVSQIVLQAATQLNLPVPSAPTEFANATVAQAAEALNASRHHSPDRANEKFPRGIDSWIRVLSAEFVEQEPRSAASAAPGQWQISSLCEHPLQAALQQAFRNVPGSGMLCLVPPDRSEEVATFLLKSVQLALKQNARQVVFVGRGAAAVARTLYLEHPKLQVKVVEVPTKHPRAVEWISREARSASGFTEAHYDEAGVRREPRLKVVWPDENPTDFSLNADDLLLVTGGGKGIAAECALALARESKCSLALLGRSDPDQDQQLRKNLLRFTESGVRFRYFFADVGEPVSSNIIQQIESELGSITAVLHGAGVNIPKRLEEITPADLHDTLSSKLGLRHILSSLSPEKFRLLVAFGSIIARTGLQGEGHYGLANDWLRMMVEDWQAQHPKCRCLNLEWSVWAGTGMGQRLGVLDSLIRQGIAPLPLDDAIGALKTMLTWKHAPVSSIVTSRFGNLPTLQLRGSELPLRRFLEHIEVYYPGIELIADADLSVDTDPYVAEHVFQGEQLLPAVCGMEAMAQVAMTLEETCDLPELHDLRFEHPIVIPPRSPVRIRITALRRRPGVVSVVVRCSTTSFQVDHFSAECLFEPTPPAEGLAKLPDRSDRFLPLSPDRDLYGKILFHQGRFRRVADYRCLLSDESVAELTAPVAAAWYARHLPADFVLGDPASRDAALHSVQVCIPHRTILPLGVDRIVPTTGWTSDRATVHAIERLRDGDDFIYDLEIYDSAGRPCESWHGLHLRAVAPIQPPDAWPLALLVPYLERNLDQFIPAAALKVMFDFVGENGSCMDEAVRRINGPVARVTHRPDGKPELAGNSKSQISFSHAGPLTLIFSGNSSLGCDVEQIASREPAMWEKLLGQESFVLAKHIAETSGLAPDTAATHIWTLKESLRKSGANVLQPANLESVTAENWIVFSAGAFAAATFHTHIREVDAAFAFGFVVRKTL